MSRISKDKRQKILLVGGVTAGLAVGLWFVMISPLRGKLQSLTTQTAEARAKVEQGKRSILLPPQVTNELATVTERLASAESLMASGDLYDWMIRTMNKFKASHAVEIPQISREAQGEVGMFPQFPYKAATWTLHGTAYFHDLGKFIAELENKFPYLQAQNLQLAAGAGSRKDQEDEHLQFSVDLMSLIKPATP
jgi:hypothetical protein